MRDYENPVHVPRLALKIFSVGLFSAFIVAPLIAALRSGNPGNLIALVGGGLALIGFIICSMYLYRLVIWFVFAFYWYIAAAVGVFLFLLSLTYISNIVSMPTLPDTMNIDPVINGLIILGAVVGLVVLYLVFRFPRKEKLVRPTPAPVTTTAAPPQQKQILNTAQQLASRKKDLGLDNDI